jgi:hypothetical protein
LVYIGKTNYFSVLRIRIRDPGLGAFLTPGSGIRNGRKSASGSGIRDEQPGSYFLEFRNHLFAFFGVKILKFFDEDPGSGMETVRIRDPGWKNVRSGINIPDPQHCYFLNESTVIQRTLITIFAVLRIWIRDPVPF